MFSFAYPGLLFLLLLVPAFIALYFWARYLRAKALERFGSYAARNGLMPSVSPYKPPIKLTLRMIALAALIVALCRPWGSLTEVSSKKEGIEVIIAVDASNSMLASATGDPGGPSRLRTAKLMLEKLISHFDNDRVGLIVYAGTAHTLIPVTSDYVSARMFLNSIEPSMISEQGTNIADAVASAMNSFGDNKKVGKAIILITDSEELEDQDAVMQVVSQAAKSGVQVDVIGVGSSTPVPINASGNTILDETGNPVMTALNEDLAAAVAKAGNGIYVNAFNRDALPELEKQLGTLKKATLDHNVFAVHDELFYVFAWIALGFLVIDAIILDTKIHWLDIFNFFRKEAKK